MTKVRSIFKMRIAFWIFKATSKYSECVIIIVSPLHQRLHERDLILRNALFMLIR
jgi:hypothetical protein